ncbi:hypothetical protein EP47_07720 [Legionella norrlandica]|uniref:Endonuclease/exonuclease/phosphatase domain-containing protein n=2 Tax=Legionella norrlandica TaxID=1498499 RepID=A0A0A2T665_9GAMM|nr:hypothetical protein EP47_07720 [Legionella norrlandica]
MLAGCSSLNQQNQTILPRKEGTIRVASYNLNWGKGAFKITAPHLTIQALDRANADIILLQETTEFWQNQLETYLATRYPYRRFYHYHMRGD